MLALLLLLERQAEFGPWCVCFAAQPIVASVSVQLQLSACNSPGAVSHRTGLGPCAVRLFSVCSRQFETRRTSTRSLQVELGQDLDVAKTIRTTA
jgi:hypothetical protein